MQFECTGKQVKQEVLNNVNSTLNNKSLFVPHRHLSVSSGAKKGVILTGQTRLRFGSVWFSSVHFGRMRCQKNHVRFTLVQYDVC